MSEDLPKQELLIKLLKMSTSPNDGEALISIRKANDLIKSAGWDWEKLIRGKIKVIEDPFKSVETPFNTGRTPAPPPPPRPRQAPDYFAQRQRPASPQPQPPRQPPPPPSPPQPLSTKSNLYAGWCYCCGDAVLAKDGFIFDPHNKNHRANSKWQIVCKQCNTSRYANIGATAAPRQRPLGNATPSLGDL